ncbi:MAG TPA: hypothetical protein VGR15_08770 [Bacteroidota bacterium]|nr:hypothetical protein [Bacteroidota bacterium]
MTNRILLATLFSSIVAVTIFLPGCTEEDVSTPPGIINTGNADFTRFVAIGNSVTAGFQSNALSQRDQVFAYPNLIANQVRTSFEIPLIKNPGIGNRIRLKNLTPTLVTEPSVPLDPSSNLNVALPRPYNNLGITGAILYDIMDTSGASSDFASKSIARGNPFFALTLRSRLFGNSIFQQAMSLQPTFITIWIGNTDVLGYAVSGGRIGSNVGPPYSADPPRTKPTETVLFSAWYRALMDSLKATGAGIVTANILDVTAIPYFTTVGPQIRANLPPGLYFRYQRNGNAGPSNPILDTTTLSGAPTDPLILLNGITYAPLLGQPTGRYYADNGIAPPLGIDTTKPFGFHPQNPWPDALTLDADEKSTTHAAVDEFNSIIDSVAANRGIGVVDIHSLYELARTQGIYVQGFGTFSSAFILGGLFSYDGVHPSSRGQAILANEWIKVINQKFDAAIPLVNIGSVPGIPIGKVAQPGSLLPVYEGGAWKDFVNLMCGGEN